MPFSQWEKLGIDSHCTVDGQLNLDKICRLDQNSFNSIPISFFKDNNIPIPSSNSYFKSDYHDFN